MRLACFVVDATMITAFRIGAMTAAGAAPWPGATSGCSTPLGDPARLLE